MAMAFQMEPIERPIVVRGWRPRRRVFEFDFSWVYARQANPQTP